MVHSFTEQLWSLMLRALALMVCSSANYWIGMVSDLAAALAFLAFGLNKVGTPFRRPWLRLRSTVFRSGVVLAHSGSQRRRRRRFPAKISNRWFYRASFRCGDCSVATTLRLSSSCLRPLCFRLVRALGGGTAVHVERDGYDGADHAADVHAGAKQVLRQNRGMR